MATTKYKDLADEIRSRPGAAKRIERKKDAMRVVLQLAELRERQTATQRELAEVMRVTQENISRLESRDRAGADIYLSTLRDYVDGLGGRLELNAVFDDEVIALGSIGNKERVSTRR